VPGRSAGLVDELIQQFADPLAFYRELVQNSIDAGARSIAVTASFEPDPSDASAGVASVAVRDDGSGMSRDVLEEQLTVLFRSGKEKQEGKIGKFGVGFVSVLAVRPRLVIVRTSEGRGEQWTMHLGADQTYELFRADGAGASGTTVTLQVPMAREAFDDFVEGSRRALEKWCRHVQVPVRWVAHVLGASAPLSEARVDRPLGLSDALVSVEAEDGPTRVVAGLPRDGQPYLACFNRGLLLYETDLDHFGAIAVKIQDPRLEHTLSRDDVRRDACFERAMRFARQVIDEQLTAKVREVAAELADRRRQEPPIDRLLAAIEAGRLDVPPSMLRFPLLHPQAAVPARSLSRDDCYVAGQKSALTEALAASGGLAVDLSVAAAPELYRSQLSALAGRTLQSPEAALTLATAVEPSGADLAMLEALTRILATTLRAPAQPRLVELAGALAGRVNYVTGEPGLLREGDARRDPFRRIARPPLLLDVNAPLVARARSAAETEPLLAGALLARAVLLEHGSLDDTVDDDWLSASLGHLLGDT